VTLEKLPPKRVRDALMRVHETLVRAAGPDQRLSKDEVARVLDELAPTERSAVDAFVAALREKHKIITVRDIDAAITEAKEKLAPATAVDVMSADVASAGRFGDGLVRLASRLAGEPAAQLRTLDVTSLKDKRGDELLVALRELCAPHVRFDYGTARDVMYAHVDGNDGVVKDRYTGRNAPVKERNALEQEHKLNAEHTRPQSQGVGKTAARTDLHHLFPTDAEANNKRGNLPFGDVVTVVWEKSGSKLGYDANGALVFEPPNDHKGDVARALFYVSAVYGLKVPPDEEKVIRAWHRRDPVDEGERQRNDRVALHQENRNPFVDDPDLVDRIEDI
jgi:hypothetical protein